MIIQPETPLSEEKLFTGRIISLHLRQVSLPNGVEVQREIISTHGGVAIVPLTTDNQVRLIRQYRSAAARWLYEIPAGTLEPAEDPAVAAPRELLEETGDRAAQWDYLGGTFAAPGILDEYLHLFLARNLTAGDNNLDFDEQIEALTVPWPEVWAMIDRGEIEDAKTIVGLTRAGLRLNLPIGTER